MDWTIQDLGALGEFVAAIATVVTLIYLAVQIRHNSRSLDRSNEFAQANSIHQLSVAFVEVQSYLAGDADLADIHTRALQGEQLTPTEETRFTAFISMYLGAVESLLAQQSLQLGYTELDTDASLELVAPYVGDLLGTDSGARWWRERAPSLYVDEFMRKINESIRSSSSSLGE